MIVKTIGSGSSGNGYALISGEDILLLECGVPAKEMLKAIDYQTSMVNGCILSHIHGDHAGYIKQYIQYGIMVYTSDEVETDVETVMGEKTIGLQRMKRQQLGTFSVIPFRVPHGETECDGWLIDTPDGRILFITDAEYCPYDFSKMHINYGLIECNYAEDYIRIEDSDPKYNHVLTGHMELETCKRLIQKINSVTDKLNDGTVEELVSDAVTKALKSSIEDQFNWKGEGKKIIDEKVKEVMTPAIERVNLDEYTVKLDAVLTEIINSTNLIDNKEILGNFKSLMTEPDKDTISLKEVFEKYKEYVSESVDTSELEVYTDDEPRYQNVTAEVTADTRNSIFGGRFCDLVFKCEEDEKLTKEIHLYESKRNGFRITRFESKLDINSLRYVDKFDIFMMRLDRAFCDITDIMEMYDDDVEVEAEPEASWN